MPRPTTSDRFVLALCYRCLDQESGCVRIAQLESVLSSFANLIAEFGFSADRRMLKNRLRNDLSMLQSQGFVRIQDGMVFPTEYGKASAEAITFPAKCDPVLIELRSSLRPN